MAWVSPKLKINSKMNKNKNKEVNDQIWNEKTKFKFRGVDQGYHYRFYVDQFPQ